MNLWRIGCFKGTFSSQVKDDVKSISDAAYMHSLFTSGTIQKELEGIQEHQIVALLALDETVEYCKSFVIVPMPNGTVNLCLGPAQLNQALLSPVHRELTINDIFSTPTNAGYMTLMQAQAIKTLNSLKLSYITTFACQFGRYRFTIEIFRVVLAGYMFQQKIDEIFKDLPIIFVLQMTF